MIPFPHDRGATVIATSTGYFDLADPRPEDISLADIARALSRINRFTGHGYRMISVARHSVNCYAESTRRGLPLDVRRLALMHDAAEAYVGDVSRPLKQLLPEYKRIEARVWSAVVARFGLSEVLPAEVKEIDNLALISEAAILFPQHDRWPGWPDPVGHMGMLAGSSQSGRSSATAAMLDFLLCARECGLAE